MTLGVMAISHEVALCVEGSLGYMQYLVSCHSAFYYCLNTERGLRKVNRDNEVNGSIL